MERIEDDDEDLQKWINAQMRQAKSASAEWRKTARECYDFVAGKQWADEDVALLTEQKRPPVTFNRIARTVNAVCGYEVQNRQEVTYIPREVGDAGVNELLTNAAKYVRDNCDAEDEESEAFADLTITGMGWTETRVDYETAEDGQLIVERVDPLEMFWDAGARKRNLDDARWTARVKPMSAKDVKELWPDYEASNKTEQWLDEEEQPHDADPPYYQDKAIKDADRKTIEVVEFQWYEKETYYRVAQSNGSVIELSKEKFDRLQPALDNMGLQTVTQTRRKYRKAFLCGGEIMEQSECPVDGLSFRCMTGMRDRNKGTWFGLVSLQLDPQRWANKWLSQIMHILNSNAKGGLLAEVDAFVNTRKAEEEWADPNSITWVNSGAIANGKIQPKPIPQYPVGLDKLLQYALESINDVPGINVEMMGLADRQQAGVLEAQRKQAGITMLATFFDAMRRYRKEQGRILAQYIREYLSDGRLIRIDGDNQQYIPLLKDQLTFEYDVIVDDAPTSPNQKDRVFGVLSQLAPQLMKQGMPMPPELLDYAPIPTSLAQKWKKMLQPDPAQQAEQKQKTDTAFTADMRVKDAKAMRDEAEAVKTVVETVAIPAKGVMDALNPPMMGNGSLPYQA